MPKKRRVFLKFLYYSFIAIILVILGAVCLGIIFYASGYRINWRANRIEKTGMLVINTKETGLSFLIDKKPVQIEKTSSSILLTSSYNLVMLPGEYDLEINQPGHLPYTEHFQVEPELITKIDNILLLPEKIPDENILIKEMVSYSFSGNNKKLAFQTPDNKVLVYNVETKEEKMIDDKTIKDKVASYAWDTQNSRVILKTSKKEWPSYYILDTDNIEKSFFLQDKLSYLPFFDNVYASPSNPDEFFGLAGKAFYKITLSSGKVDRLADSIDRFMAKKVFFYYQNSDASLIQFDPRSYRENVILEKFPLSEDFDIMGLTNESRIYLKNRGSLYLIKNKNNLDLIDKDVDTLTAESNDSQFLYIKGFEIWNYDSRKEDKALISRFSKKIEDIQEFFDNTYLLYQQDKDINFIRKDGKNEQTVHNEVEAVRVYNGNMVLVLEQKGNQKLLKSIDFTSK